MYTLRSQRIFNPMETTFFKRTHTGTCIDNGYDLNSMVALSNLFKLNNQGEQTPALAAKDTVKDAAECISANDLLTNQTLISNLVSNTGLPSNLLANHQPVVTTAANLLDSFKTSTQSIPKTTNKLASLSYYPFEQLQNTPATLFGSSNPSSIDLARTLQLIAELSSSNPFNQSSFIQPSIVQQSTLPTTSSSFNQHSSSLIQQSSNQLTRSAKRQKIIPNPIQLTYSNFNPNNEQVQPLDLSIKSASSTNSERFILEPLNLSRSNSPEELMEKSKNNSNLSPKIDNSNLNIVQIQNALCKKKKIMIQRAAELLKKSSCSSAPCSPSSIATSSSPSDQPFDLDTSQSNQSNLEICLPTLNDPLNQLNKKRKFSDSNLSLDSQITSNPLNSQQKLPKLKGKRRQLNSKQFCKPSVTSLDESEIIVSNNQQQPSTIIIDAKNTFNCSICGEMFAFKDRLSKHIKSKHRTKSDQNELKSINVSLTSQQTTGNGRSLQNQKSYQCKICYRSFSRSDMLTRHSRKHTGLKPFSCEICNSEFTRSDHLATHKRTHSGEKPYKCSKCIYTACRRDMITRHMKTHNNGDKNKSSNSVVLLVPTKNNSSSPLTTPQIDSTESKNQQLESSSRNNLNEKS